MSARLLSGEFQTYDDEITLKASQPGTFAPGTVLHGRLYFGDGWDWGFTFTFAATIP
jgi:hypothetical protein